MVRAAEVVASPLTYGGMVGVQVYRYVRVYDPVQRQRTKWFVFAFGVAILRYRLWDIDVIINRTLIYGSLTDLLVALYFGLILALQALVRAVTGSLSQQPLVIVGSTTLIAALFQPLRRCLQASIDRHFYRHKFDAA